VIQNNEKRKIDKKKLSKQFDIRPCHRHTRTVQSYSPGFANMCIPI